jgi:hypothetical protein
MSSSATCTYFRSARLAPATSGCNQRMLVGRTTPAAHNCPSEPPAVIAGNATATTEPRAKPSSQVTPGFCNKQHVHAPLDLTSWPVSSDAAVPIAGKQPCTKPAIWQHSVRSVHTHHLQFNHRSRKSSSLGAIHRGVDATSGPKTSVTACAASWDETSRGRNCSGQEFDIWQTI